MQLLLDEPYAKIMFDATTNSTGLTWHGPVTSQQYRTVFAKALEILSAYNTPNWVSDISHQGPVSKEDQLWMFNTILPDAAKNGLKRIATIEPYHNNHNHVRDYVNDIELNIGKFGILYKSFRTHKETIEWIMEETEKATSLLKS